MRTLLIDNYDSFTYNLFQLLAEVNGEEPLVVRNDEADWARLERLEFDNVVLSPGPGRPERERDFGICAEAIRRCQRPLLGVCLGHQGIGWVHGGRVVPAPEPLHGRVRAVEHDGAALFAGIPERFEATRYHSLCLEAPLPPELQPIAWAEDGMTMALAHRSRPQWGVQFHPESVATEHGRRLLANFRDLSAPSPLRGSSGTKYVPKEPRNGGGGSEGVVGGPLELKVRRLETDLEPARAFAALYGESRDAFWLDSSRLDHGARFSFMGDASGPLGSLVTYDVEAGEVTVERDGRTEVLRESIFDYLERELERLRPDAAALPFEFDCGFVGYLGYELKADCGCAAGPASDRPDAAFLLADRVLAFDHAEGHVYLLCLVEPGEEAVAGRWLEETGRTLEELAARAPSPPSQPAGPAGDLRLARSPRRYLDDVAVCERRLREGESYELCLTNSIAAEIEADPLSLYMELRRVNPAPFASYLRFGELSVLSSSPERFVAVDRGGAVEARPIKGTARRGATAAEDARLAERLRASEKNRAENLMIVDLLRNDLGSVCETGSVEVPSLMAVEAHETVHQLVSTVSGRLRPRVSAPACARACFPPGSMTGAPKRRATEILGDLEAAPRGIYSGAIGYFGLGGGCDLSVTIRTIVLDRGLATVGAGGAIVLQSDAQNELEEVLLKAGAVLAAFGESVTDRLDSAFHPTFRSQPLAKK